MCSLVLDDCNGNKTWYVQRRRVKEVKANQTAVCKGKRFKITYRCLGGEKKCGYKKIKREGGQSDE